MTTSANHVPHPTQADLPVVVPQPSPPAEPDQPDSSPPPDISSAVPPPREPRDRAAETRWRRSEQRGRVMLIESSAQLQLRVRHPNGGDCSVEEILAEERTRRAEIDRDIAAGSKKHNRLPRWLRSVPKWVLGFDFGLLLYFFSGITNVDWSDPWSLALAFAVTLAAMVTLLSYGFLSFTGTRLRCRKNDNGTIFHEDVCSGARQVFAAGDEPFALAGRRARAPPGGRTVTRRAVPGKTN